MKALGKGSVAALVEVALTIAWWLLWVALAAVIVGALGYAGITALIGAGPIDPNILSGGEGEARIGAADADYDLTFDNPGGATWPVVVPALTIGAVVIVGGLIIVGRLRRLFHSFTSGEPFRRENAQHLRVIWITMLAMEFARLAAMLAVAALFAAVGLPPGADANFSYNIDVSTWMSIAVLVVLAEVFREGARLREEQELTI